MPCIPSVIGFCDRRHPGLLCQNFPQKIVASLSELEKHLASLLASSKRVIGRTNRSLYRSFPEPFNHPIPTAISLASRYPHEALDTLCTPSAVMCLRRFASGLAGLAQAKDCQGAREEICAYVFGF